ncbi:hypothetical protein WJX73_006556 [Symbiochloris irregularis]|uniref:Glycosyl transferase 48 domain-containing protein n=1 Tax=Symbiochloris irregularis TaxID=706552 RepID=A0AAW1NRG4_9CHLO
MYNAPWGYFLAVFRVSPNFIAACFDTSLFFTIYAALFGLVKGYLQLNLGFLVNFEDVRSNFHQAPRHYAKVMRPLKSTTKHAGAGLSSVRTLPRNFSAMLSNVRGVFLNQPSAAAFVNLKSLDSQGLSTVAEESSRHGSLPLSSKSAQSGFTEDLELGGQSETSFLRNRIWGQFSEAWHEIVSDLRNSDCLSDQEVRALQFLDLRADRPGTHNINSFIKKKEAKDLPGLYEGVMMPAFFRAGILDVLVRADSLSDSQQTAVMEVRDWLVWLLTYSGGIDEADSATRCALRDFKPVHPCSTDKQLRARIGAVCEARKLLQAFLALKAPMAAWQASRGQIPRALAKAVGSLFQHYHALLTLVDNEMAVADSALRSRSSFMGMSLPGSSSTAALSANHQQIRNLRTRIGELSAGLLGEQWSETQYTDLVYIINDRFDLKHKVASHMLWVLSPVGVSASPRSHYAQRVIRFFLGSLRDRTMHRPPAVTELRSLTTLTPHLREPVIYPVSTEAVAEQFDLPHSSCQALDDLISTKYNGTSLMAYLRSTYPHEWNNFKERLEREMGTRWPWPHHDFSALSEIDFVRGGALYEQRHELMTWASCRGQLLLRTTTGMACYQRALRFHARSAMPANEAQALARSKYSYVVSSQVFGEDRKSAQGDARWRAHCIEKLLRGFPELLSVAYVDSRGNARQEGQTTQYSVLIGAVTDGSAADDSPGHVERYRIQLPVNDAIPLEGPRSGIMLGEGKPENQNHAIIFCFGECLQSIDMNQDNNFAEALKLPNMLGEFDKVDSQNGARSAATDDIVCVGFREWIFTEDAGAQGAFAASTEFAFGTISQRVMASPGAVRFHYGHPDLWNKLWVMTRGGVCKATKGLHISEDVYAGYNHVLRGGKIVFREFMEAGKGRDNGFDGINGFAAKVSGGNGEQMLSRDINRLGKRLDFFRMLSFYHSGPGFYLNTFLVLLGVYATVWAYLIVTIAGAQRLAIDDKGNLYNTITGRTAGLSVVTVLQLGFLGFLLYAAESCLEHGVLACAATIASHVITGSPLFFIFRARTQAFYFLEDVLYGGAQYVATGRGFALQRSSFVKIYTMYARSHLYWGLELVLLLALLWGIGLTNYFASTVGVWVVAFAVLFSPLWFNPNAFSLTHVMEDFQGWQVWMRGGLDESTQTTWHAWHRDQVRRRTDSDHARSHAISCAIISLVAKVPSLAIAIFALRFGIETPGRCKLIISCNQWADWGIFTGGMLALLAVFLVSHRFLLRFRRIWRIFVIVLAVAALGLVISYYVLYRISSSTGGRVFYIWVFTDFQLLVVLSQVVLQAEAVLRSKCDLNLGGMRRLSSSFYMLLDYILGYCYFLVLFVLAYTRVAMVLQSVLLFNVSFGMALIRGRLFEGFYIKDWVDHQIGQRRRQAHMQSESSPSSHDGPASPSPLLGTDKGLKTS